MLRLLLLVSFCLSAAPTAAQPVSAVLGAPLAGSVVVGSASGRVNGSGRESEEVRALEPFAALRANGPIDIELKASDREQVTVIFDDNLLAMIETRVTAGTTPTLEVQVAPGAAFKSSNTPRVVVEFKTLGALSLRGSGDLSADLLRAPVLAIASAGSGDVRIKRLEVDVLGVSLAGSGDFSAAGRATEQGYSIAGSGDVDAGELIGRTVKVRIAGSGDARVHAEQLLDVAVAGSGDVVYRGTPVIRKSIAGSGDVRRAR